MTRVGQVWDYITLSHGPWLIVGQVERDADADGVPMLFVLSWRAVSLTAAAVGIFAESSFQCIEGGFANGWRRLL